jgi:hypothetical protein
MAIVTNPLEGRVTMVLNNGLDGDGNILTVNKSYSKVKPTAENDSIFAVIEGLSSLQEKPLVVVKKTEEYELINMD